MQASPTATIRAPHTARVFIPHAPDKSNCDVVTDTTVGGLQFAKAKDDVNLGARITSDLIR